MHFSVTHHFDASRIAVADVMCDPAFQTTLSLPDLSLPEVVEHVVDGTTRMLRLRYQYVGQLDPIARRVIGGHKVTWIQELRLDVADFRGTLSYAAESDAKKFFGAADITLDGDDAPSTRRIDGDLHVKVPLVGGMAEKRIVPGLVRRLDAEAAAMAEKLGHA